MRFGALQYFECKVDDMEVAKKNGCLYFPKMADTKKDEVVFFYYL